jgi:organic radical activating enzyme
MNLLPGESLLQYKHRVVDSISDSACGAKLYNATIWLESGMTTSCHHPPAHKIDAEEIKTNPSAIHNTKQKKIERQQMLCGERPSGCEYCWKLEDSNPKNVSDRVFKTIIYTDEENFSGYEKVKLNPDFNFDTKTLEVSFSSTCQLACSYCNASFSSTWSKDIKNGGPYQLVSDGSSAFQHDGAYTRIYENKENPYVNAFWSWWDSGLKNSLTELRITGGEPLMSKDVWKLMDKFADEKLDVRLAVNSNLMAKDELIDKFIEKSHSIKNLKLYTSCEAQGSQAEYIRDGLEWNTWLRNLNKVVDGSSVKSVGIMLTINALCLDSICEFMDQMVEIKKRKYIDVVSLSFNILRFPSFQSPNVLSTDLKEKYASKIEDWLKNNQQWFRQHEAAACERLINYLREVTVGHSNSSDIEKLQADFKSFHKQYDLRRGKNFKTTFPNLTYWYSTL